MRNSLAVSSFYKFFPIDPAELPVKKLSLEARAAKFDVRGLIIIAEEGCNGTISGEFEAVQFFEQSLPILFGNAEWTFKRGHTVKQPFRDFRVKIRPEIVTTRGDVQVEEGKHALEPGEWQKLLDEDSSVVVLDTRNSYETALGMFRGALDPKIENFSEFPEAVRKLAIPKEKKILMYCTGGIRCEKAIIEMERMGYEDVHQLQGGILSYLELYPHRSYEGECFVFDGRVAVDQNLIPTRRWSLCPHCGQPGHEAISCESCGRLAVICESCVQHRERIACSHDCRYRLQQGRTRQVANA